MLYKATRHMEGSEWEEGRASIQLGSREFANAVREEMDLMLMWGRGDGQCSIGAWCLRLRCQVPEFNTAVLVLGLTFLLPVQYPVNTPGLTAEDDPSPWVPDTGMETGLESLAHGFNQASFSQVNKYFFF